MLADRTYLVGSSPFNSRAVGSWQGPGQPITLTVYGPGGEVAVALSPVRALELAQELTQSAVVSIKTAQRGDTRGRARGPISVIVLISSALTPGADMLVRWR